MSQKKYQSKCTNNWHTSINVIHTYIKKFANDIVMISDKGSHCDKAITIISDSQIKNKNMG